MEKDFLKSEDRFMDNYVMDMQKKVLIKMYGEAIDAGHTFEAIDLLKKAVECGYKGDYSYIGITLFWGVDGIPRNTDDGAYWIGRFIIDYDNEKLGIIPPHKLFICYYSLMIYNFRRVLDRHLSDFEKEKAVCTGKTLLRKALEYTDGCHNLEANEMIYMVAKAFFEGKFALSDDVCIPFDKDYKTAIDLFHLIYKSELSPELMKEAKRYLMIAYRDRLGMTKNTSRERLFFLEMAIDGDRDATRLVLDEYVNRLMFHGSFEWEDDDPIEVKIALGGNEYYSGEIHVMEFIDWLKSATNLYSLRIFNICNYSSSEIITILSGIVNAINNKIGGDYTAEKKAEALVRIAAENGNKISGVTVYDCISKAEAKVQEKILRRLIENRITIFGEVEANAYDER